MNQTETFRWHQLASVQIGGAICLPVILIGYELARLFGPASALVAIGAGNFFLAILAAITSEMTWKNKLTTPENAGYYLGKVGKKCVSLLLACSMCGWFAIQTQVVTQDLARTFSVTADLVGIGLAGLFAGSLLYGLGGITRLSDLAVPAMCATLFVVLFSLYGGDVRGLDAPYSFDFKAISMVIALAVGVCMDMPTFFCKACSRKESLIGALATTLIGLPLVEVCGVYLYAWSGSTSLMEALRACHWPLWDTWIMLFLILAAWTTNTTNLYSAAMGVSSLLPRLPWRTVLWVTAILAILVSQLDFISHLAQVLDTMGVFLASAYGVILAAFLVDRALAGWWKGVSFATGLATGLFYPEGIAVLNAALISSFTLYLGKFLCTSTRQTSMSLP